MCPALFNSKPSISGQAQIFFSLYFLMTGMHALHMIIGWPSWPGWCGGRERN